MKNIKRTMKDELYNIINPDGTFMNIEVPPCPTKVSLNPKTNLLKVEQNAYALFDPQINAFIGGKFNPMDISKDGWPVFVKFTNGKIIITQLINCLIDKENDTYLGGEEKILLELDLK